MAKFVVNSTNTEAIRKEQVGVLSIKNNVITGTTSFELWIKSTEGKTVRFEVDPTLEGAQAKASTVLAALGGDINEIRSIKGLLHW
jgi:hypothetical protein